MLVGRGEAIGQRPPALAWSQTTSDARLRHRGAARRVVDHAGRRTDDASVRAPPARRGAARSRSCIASTPSRSRSSRTVEPGRGLDVDVGVAPRPAEPLRRAPPDRRLAGAHQAGDDDVVDGCPSPQGSPLHSAPWEPQPPIAPPAIIGILGGGQLGRMLGMAAPRDGLPGRRARPGSRLPGGRRSPILVVVGAYDDIEAALRLAECSDVVTYELEHVAAGGGRGGRGSACRSGPGRGPLLVTQDRLAERRFVEGAGIAVAPWREVAFRGGGAGRRRGARPAAAAQAADRRLRRPWPDPDRGRRRARRRLGAARRPGRRRRCSPSASSSSRRSCRSIVARAARRRGRDLPDRPQRARRGDPRRDRSRRRRSRQRSPADAVAIGTLAGRGDGPAAAR